MNWDWGKRPVAGRAIQVHRAGPVCGRCRPVAERKPLPSFRIASAAWQRQPPNSRRCQIRQPFPSYGISLRPMALHDGRQSLAFCAPSRVQYSPFSFHYSFRRLAAYMGRHHDPGWGPLGRTSQQRSARAWMTRNAARTIRHEYCIITTMRLIRIWSELCARWRRRSFKTSRAMDQGVVPPLRAHLERTPCSTPT